MIVALQGAAGLDLAHMPACGHYRNEIMPGSTKGLPQFIVGPFEALVGAIVNMIAHFNSRDTAFIVAFAILIGSALIWAIPILRLHLAFTRHMDRAIATVRRATANAGWSAEDMLAAADEALSNNAFLAELWRPYRAALRPDPRLESRFVNPVDPQAWFAYERLPGRGYEKWASTLAGVTLTLGLLFTFVGLTAALFKVGDVGTDTTKLREAISEILRISSAKFITSMAGILAYIAWTLVARSYASVQAKLAHRLASAIQGLSAPITPESILLDGLEESRRQTSRLKTLADDMAVALDASLNKVLGARLDGLPALFGDALQPALERSVRPVVEAIQGMGGSIGDGNQAALERMIGELRTEVANSAGTEMRMLSEAMREAAGELSAAKSGIGSGGTEFGEAIARAAEQMSASTERMSEAMGGRAMEIDQRMASIEGALSAGAGRLQDMGDSMSRQMSDGLARAMESMAAAASEGVKVARENSQAALAPVLEDMLALMRELRRSADDSGSALVAGGRAAASGLEAALAKAGADLSSASRVASDELADAFRRSTGTMVDGVEEALGGYRTATDALAARLAQVEQGFGALERAVARNVSQLDETGGVLSEAGRTFGTASDQLRQAAGPVLATLQSVEGAAAVTRESLRAMQDTGGALRDTATAMTASSEAAAQAFASYENRFAGVDEALGRTIATMRDGVVELGERVTEVVQGYDDHLARAIGSLRSGVSEMKDAIEELGDKLPVAA